MALLRSNPQNSCLLRKQLVFAYFLKQVEKRIREFGQCLFGAI